MTTSLLTCPGYRGACPAAPLCEHHAAVAAPPPPPAPARTILFWPKEEEQRPVIRRNPMRGDWWILNRRRSGWGERGYYYGTLAELVARWACRIVGRAQDTHGEYLVLEEAPQDEAPQDVSAWEVTS